MEREALKLALKVLEDLPGFRADIDNAITAIKEALAQPAQREWVGLTEKDLKPICDGWRIVYGAWVDDFAQAIEAKLKDKNT